MSCRASFGVGVVIVLGITLRLMGVAAYPPGFSYSKFSGPVSGPEHEIIVKDEHGKQSKDYVAKPDYQFSYGVEDPKSKVKQSRKESRNGDEVHGEYSVVEPDGSVRTVKYTADKKNGFQAQVYHNGKIVEHGNTGSGDDDHSGDASHENSQQVGTEGAYQVQHDYQGSHSMEQGNHYKDGSNSLSKGKSSSEEGYDHTEEDDEEGGDEGDDDEEEEGDDEE